MKRLKYVMANDSGLAPNPYFGICSLRRNPLLLRLNLTLRHDLLFVQAEEWRWH
ncbi:hypothetical protein [Burkholderia ubonensis]|uniref:hypothetical protein n=1 Tax=Burkholderia ubonensis TaxID=101571 RepID=UPI0015C30798|nr:hypothetical protein [Burkholderia ubonensis]